ncbi:MAG: hypothetical protein LBO74_08535 [Candidatus Symbiothrix sp.]|jgi:hypothetical protein|nr:hypothetical protein [Candidatus Symbiothrix sp.]
MDVLQSLKSLSNYPIPTATVNDIAEGLGLDIETVLTPEIRNGASFKRAQARIYKFLSECPDVSQGGISYSFTDEDRRRFRLNADSILDELGDGGNLGVAYGYMGSDL